MNNIIKKLIESLGENKYLGCRIFVLHTKKDEEFAKELIKELRLLNFLCWDGENCILPGQLHNIEQEKAIFDADFIIAVMSKATQEEEGRYAKLLRIALEAQEEKGEGGIKLISVIISQTELPYEYRKYKPLDLTDINNVASIAQSIKNEFDRRKQKGIRSSKSEAMWK